MTSSGPTVGILAYGSLIDDPGDELGRVMSRIVRDVTTPFEVEFARASGSRGDAPTLVPHAAGARVRAAVLVVDTTPELATDMLWRRETRQRDASRRYPGPRAERPNAVMVRRLEDFSGLDVVLYTEIGSNLTPLTADRLAEHAIASVARAEQGLDGISYLIAAKRNGIATPLSAAYEKEILRRTGTDNLEAALQLVRGREGTSPA